MPANNRIYYAIQQVRMGESAKTGIHGLQSVGITTNFNLEQVFELGQLAIYQNVETIPDIEITLNKILDGYPLIYTQATELGSQLDASDLIAINPTLAGRQNARTDLELTIFADSQLVASGTPINTLVCSGVYVNNVSYTFPVDGNFTEDVTLVGNNKVWGANSTTAALSVGSDDTPLSSTGIGRRQFLNMSNCRFPTQIPGIGSDGVNSQFAEGAGLGYKTHFQNITVSCDFGREAINELGTNAPYHRYVTFPVEVTCEFEVLAISGDMINATEDGYYSGLTGSTPYTGSAQCDARHNLLDDKVYLETCEGTKIHLGNKNKLSSVSYGGGDAGGGNATVTYSYTTFNDFVVAHSGGRTNEGWYNDLTESNWTSFTDRS